MRREATIADLGVGNHDGEAALLEFGDTALKVRWRAADSKWYSKAEPTIRMRGDWKLSPSGGASQGQWSYVSEPFGNYGQIGQSSFTYDPHTIRDADAAYAAGLVLQHHFSHVFWNFTLGESVDLGLILYAVTDTDMISTLAVPAGNVGAYLTSGNGQRKWQTTGWVNSTIPTPTKPMLAPHLYSRWTGTGTTGSFHLEYLRAMSRWSGAAA